MLNEITEDLVEGRRYVLNKEEYYNAHKKEIQEVAAALKLGKSLMGASCCADSCDIRVSGDMIVLKHCFSVFRRLGYEPSSRPTEVKTSSFNCWFTHPAKTGKFYFCFSSTKYTRKKIGTETREIDVYETVCDE